MGNRPSQSTSGRSWPRDVRELFRSARRNHGNGDRGDFADSGIQQRSNASEGQGHAPGQKPGGNGRKTWRDKLNSCPDLQTAAAKGHCQQPNTCIQQDIKPPTQLNYKIYRSYSDLPPDDAAESDARGRSSKMASCADIPVIEVRVYRRSTETLSTAGDRRRTQSLPRGMDLRRSLGSDLAGAASAATGSGSSGDSRRGSTSLHSSSHYTDMAAYSRSTSRKASARSSMASIGARVTAEEFPDSTTVRRKVDEFERNFVTTFVDAFKCLAPLNQLAAVSIATRPDHANQAVSLLQYLESEAIPVDIVATNVDGDNDETAEYCLTIAPLRCQLTYLCREGDGGEGRCRSLEASEYKKAEFEAEFLSKLEPEGFAQHRFPEVRRLKLEGPVAADRRLAVCHLLVEDMARDAARELSRMFEYQLSLINEQIALRLLARHAVDCILNAARRRSRILDANALVRGVIRGRPPCNEGPMFVSVFVGNRELKWNLNELFKKPALRRELFPGVSDANRPTSACTLGVPSSASANGSIIDDWKTEMYRTPWRYFTSPRCDPMRYGYRGQIVERDYVNGGYRLNSEDESFFQEEVTVRYDDFHRVYSPLRRLVSIDTLCDYCTCAVAEQQASASGNGGIVMTESTGSDDCTPLVTGLAEYVRRSVPGESYARDEIDVAFRPLGVALPDAMLTAATPYTPADILSLVRVAVNRKQSNSRHVTNGSSGGGKEGGVRRVAIEVTRACDELSGRLQGEFSWMVSSPVDGSTTNESKNGDHSESDVAPVIERKNRSSRAIDDRTSTDV